MVCLSTNVGISLQSRTQLVARTLIDANSTRRKGEKEIEKERKGERGGGGARECLSKRFNKPNGIKAI